MQTICDQTFDEERALYGSRELVAERCRFDGPADGESAFKESSGITARDCFFNLRYPFWHVKGLKIDGGEMTELCRAAIWYSHGVEITGTKMHGIKALRECGDVKIDKCDIVSPEFGWSVSDLTVKETGVESEYAFMRSDHLFFDHVKLKGKYSFQYISDSVFTNCEFDTKDAFWHAKNVVVKDSTINGEYLAWYCENVVFENCVIKGTQPLCYCKGLKLINCIMIDCDLSFEKSDVDAVVLSSVVSIKNPKSGKIVCKSVGEIISDDPEAKGQIEVAP
ncbi:MAG: DUF3737 family protein [Clostridiales bacterium]|nr:DUF3737 family protein [Clostridiales bacterium]